MTTILRVILVFFFAWLLGWLVGWLVGWLGGGGLVLIGSHEKTKYLKC
jgi:hypothetical protein